jgi:hypothetical protein
MVARTTISDGWRARAHALVALARAWRPQEILPGARTWTEAETPARAPWPARAGTWRSSRPPMT